jgi:hypothetical protein
VANGPMHPGADLWFLGLRRSDVQRWMFRPTRRLLRRLQIGRSNSRSPEFDWGFRAWSGPPAWVGCGRDQPPLMRGSTAITREKSGRLDLNQRPFGPQPSGFRCPCVSERPSRPMCPGPWTIWTDRTMHRVPKRYHGTGSRSGTPVRRALQAEGCLQARATAPPSAAKCCFAWKAALSVNGVFAGRQGSTGAGWCRSGVAACWPEMGE